MKKFFKYLIDECRYSFETLKAIRSYEFPSKSFKYINDKIKININTEKISNLKDNIEIPIIFDQNFIKYMQKFMHSFRNKDHPTININNLLIINGPELIGKSWFLRHNLKLFEDSPGVIKNIAIHYDLREIENQNFYSFLYNFEERIIKAIIDRNQIEIIEKNLPLINTNDIQEIFFYRYEKGWTEINLIKSIKRGLSDESYSYYINKEFQNELIDLIEKYENKAFKEYFMIENINSIIIIISKSMNISDLEALLRLFQDCLIQREDISKDHVLFENEVYRTGIEVMEFLFDVLNYISGYHEKHLKEEEYRNIESKRRIFPHVVLALESVQDLLEMTGVEHRSSNYIHRILLRCYNDSGYRNHFPVILETNKNFYFDREIYDKLWENKWAFPTLLYMPVEFYNNIADHMDEVLSSDQKEYFYSILQHSPIYYYKLLLESYKIYCNSNFNERAFLIFNNRINKITYKINKLYLNKHLSNILDNNNIDYELYNVLNQFIRIFKTHNQPYISIRKTRTDFTYFQQPMTKALLDESILFFNKYNKQVSIENHVYNYVIESKILSRYKFKILEKIFYHIYYSPIKSFKFSTNGLNMGHYRRISKIASLPWEHERNLKYHGYNPKWDVPNELYKGKLTLQVNEKNNKYSTII